MLFSFRFATRRGSMNDFVSVLLDTADFVESLPTTFRRPEKGVIQSHSEMEFVSIGRLEQDFQADDGIHNGVDP